MDKIRFEMPGWNSENDVRRWASLQERERQAKARDAERLECLRMNSAYEYRRVRDNIDAAYEASRKENELKHKAALATIELNELTKKQNQILREQLEKLTVEMEGRKVGMASKEYEFDVFVSHANDNKQSFVDSLSAGLNRLGIKVWYDSSILDWGDDWKAKIKEGLGKSRFGIVVLSPQFIGREWTTKELTELLNRQNERHEKVVLPLLYNLTVDGMKAKYPDLAPIQARSIREDEDAKDVVIDFARILIRALKSE